MNNSRGLAGRVARLEGIKHLQDRSPILAVRVAEDRWKMCAGTDPLRGQILTLTEIHNIAEKRDSCAVILIGRGKGGLSQNEGEQSF